jgi:GNAT superfamily N-acetyltransferase
MIVLRRLTSADLDFAFALKEQAGWNQTRADWRRFLSLQPDGCFLAEWEGRSAGTVAAFLFDSVAWIAMMLVEASLRGRGLGRALMDQALDYACQHGAVTVRLDSTPLGQPLYEKLGFMPDYGLTRYGGIPSHNALHSSELPQLTVDDAAVWDHLATGANRRRLLNLLWKEQPGCCVLLYCDVL